MNEEKKIKKLEFRIFDLEKNVDLLNQKVIQLTETLSFHHTEPKISKKTALDIDNLLNIEEACDILNLSKSKLMEWVQSDLIKAELIKRLSTSLWKARYTETSSSKVTSTLFVVVVQVVDSIFSPPEQPSFLTFSVVCESIA